MSSINLTDLISSTFSGNTGPGVANGGVVDQALVKSSNADFDTTWVTLDTDFVLEGNTNLYFIEAPSDGQQYVRQDANWVTVDIPEGYDSNNFTSDFSLQTTDDLTEGNTNLYWIEAPSDGQQYVRQDADWVTVDIPEGYGDSEVITLLGGNVNTSIIPSLDITYDLGSANNRWRDLYLSGNTINLGDAQIKSDENTGTISIIPPVSSGNPNPRAMIFNSQGHMRSVDTTGGVLQSNALSQVANTTETDFDSITSNNLTIESNLTLPVGNTAQRPVNPVAGMIRYNTDEGYIEYYNADFDEWVASNERVGINATGGTITEITDNGVNYRVHTFTSSGTFDVTFAPENAEVEYLVVAGGGGGHGSFQSPGGGGGGAGGLLDGSVQITSQSYSIFVGAGGGFGRGDGASVSFRPTSGANSSALGLVAVGGGYGGGYEDFSSGGGGSSGGEAYAGGLGSPVQNQGNSGGSADQQLPQSSAGGGGAGNVGEDSLGDGSTAGAGGDGIQSTINGDSKYYAGGGAGGAGALQSSSDRAQGGLGGGGDGGIGGDRTVAELTGQSAAVNTGGGGGGAGGPDGAQDQTEQDGGSGGSGIVIIRYPI